MRKTVMISLLVSASLFAADYSSVIEKPNASKIIKEDLLGKATVYTMPKDCITTDKDAIARGAYIFHNLNSAQAGSTTPKGIVIKKGETKQYGNCVACHNIEKAQGGGNVGPDLTGYKAMFMDSGVRDNQFVFQKIADPRIDNKNTNMTVNLTTKLFTPKEICEITSYVISTK
jgi:sulfur-oxidizing protein SoxX